MTIKKGTVQSVVAFLLNPFLAIPFILYGMKNRRKVSEILMIIILSLISYLYIPSLSDDRTRFIERYELFENMNFSQYLYYLALTMRPDFIYETLIYLFSQLGIKIDILFLLVTFITLYQLYQLISKVSRLDSKLVLFSLFFISVSFLNVFSGVRFYLGFSFITSSLYYMYVHPSKIRVILFLLLALFTHFSMTLPIIAIFILYFFNRLNYKFIFFASLVFLIIPSSLLYTIIQKISLFDIYSNKIDIYLSGDEELVFENLNSSIAFYGRMIWYYLIIGFLFFSKKENNLWLKLFFIMGALVNLTYTYPVIFQRYSLILKFIFLLYFVSESEHWRKSFLKYTLVISYLIGSLIDINQMRYNLLDSLVRSNSISLLHIFSTSVSKNEIKE